MADFYLPVYTDALSDGVGIVDVSGRILAANEALARMLGYESKEHFLSIGCGDPVFLTAADVHAMEGLLPDGPGLAGRPCPLRMRHGTERMAAVTVVRRADGMLDAVFVADPDSASAELERLHSLLRSTQSHMVQTERTKAVGSLAGFLAHELNNVFGSVIGRAQLMQMKTTDERLLRECAYIVQAAEQGVGEVKRLLQFIHKSRQQSFGPMCVEDVFDEACAVVEPSFERCRTQHLPIVITRRFGKHAMIFGYACEVREVIAHVLQNAFDAMPNGGEITAACEYGVEDFSLTITDTGTGIASDVQSKMFEPMFTTKDELHAGMGLTIVKELLRKMKGSLVVKTEFGKGSVFTITIPKNDVMPNDAGRQPQNRPSDMDPRFVSKILIVDDDEGVLLSLERLLSSKGFVTKAILDSRDAVRLARTFQPDVVITDLAMPEMNGWELAKHMRMICPSSKIILTTAFIDMLTDVQMKQTAVDVVLQKPVNIQELMNTIMTA